MPADMLTTGDLARLLGVKKRTVYSKLQRGSLPQPDERVGDSTSATLLWHRETIEAWLAEQPSVKAWIGLVD